MNVLLTAALKPELSPLQNALGHLGITFLCTGVGKIKTTHKLLANHPLPAKEKWDLIISTGCCGALDPSLSIGDLVLAHAVLDQNSEQKISAVYCPDPKWRQSIKETASRANIKIYESTLLSVDRALTDIVQKNYAWEQTGAMAVDMETSAIAAAAQKLGCPYLSLRFVVDTANEELVLGANSSTMQLSMADFEKRIAQNIKPLVDILRELLTNY